MVGRVLAEARDVEAAGALAGSSTIRVSARVAEKVGRKWVGKGAVKDTAKNGTSMLRRGSGNDGIAYRSPMTKAGHTSANLTKSVPGRHDYFNFHINVR